MKKEQDVRGMLLTNTIRIVADGGFEKATTKAITHSGGALSDVNMNEVYIYRLFGSKQGLYAAAFDRVEAEIALTVISGISKIRCNAKDIRQEFYKAFLEIWTSLLENEAHLRFYIKYYHSAYFNENPHERYDRNFEKAAELLSPFFRGEISARLAVHSLLAAMLELAEMTLKGELTHGKDTTEQVFDLLYEMALAFFKDEFKRTEP